MSYMAYYSTLHKLCSWLWVWTNGDRLHEKHGNILIQENLAMY